MSRMPLLHQLPNMLTLLRIGAVPVLILFLHSGRYGAALAVFLIAGITDGLDGWIAKRFDAVTRLGSILDPLADKMLSSALTLCWPSRVISRSGCCC